MPQVKDHVLRNSVSDGFSIGHCVSDGVLKSACAEGGREGGCNVCIARMSLRGEGFAREIPVRTLDA